MQKLLANVTAISIASSGNVRLLQAPPYSKIVSEDFIKSMYSINARDNTYETTQLVCHNTQSVVYSWD